MKGGRRKGLSPFAPSSDLLAPRSDGVSWPENGQPPTDIDQAVNAAIGNQGWPPGAKQALRDINFTWRSSAPVDLAHTIWFLNERSLAIGPAFTDQTVLTGNLAKAQVQLLAFEFGKLIHYNAESQSSPLLKDIQRFAGQIPVVLPDVPEVREGADRHALFGYAYYYFIFEPDKLPRELVAKWRLDPPHAIVRDIPMRPR